MSELSVNQFSDFFHSIHGDRPFEWQERLARDILGDKGWPDVIRIPTGCGKTSVLDLALFELALQANKEPNQRTAARRICFVVDRRLVVDDVTNHAKKIYNAIIKSTKEKNNNPVLNIVADRLGSLSIENNKPLRIVKLRGGVYQDDGWAADPLTPTIIISTVDQIGSRLLFRGYGVSHRSRPVHAGLLAFDTRIILDEAHLSTSFTETLEYIQKYQKWAKKFPIPTNRHLSVVRMSATARESTKPFELTAEERKDERLVPRLEANKPAELIEVKVEAITKQMNHHQARQQERENRELIVKELLKEAKRLAGFDGNQDTECLNTPRVIGIVVNRVLIARSIFEELSRDKQEWDVILLTGRIRSYNRDRLLEVWLPRIKVGRTQQPDRPLFVVSTQTVEVGANIDFDAMVTEAAPIDALRQRFGRLDRLGKRYEHEFKSPAVIVIRSDQKSKSEDDPIYGQAIAETWKWLNSKDNATIEGKGKSKRLWIDFGVNHLDPKLLDNSFNLLPMLAPQPETPLLFPAHLDAWVQTNPIPEPDPDVEPFLHGKADNTADVQVIWRADLTKDNNKNWEKIVSLMPPRTLEALPVPIYELKAWLKRQAEGDIADIEGVPTKQFREQKHTRPVVLWRGKKETKKIYDPNDVKPGDTIIVPAIYGGADDFGWNPSSKKVPVKDIAESCLAQLIASYPDDAFRIPKLRLRLYKTLWINREEKIRKRLDAILNSAISDVRSEDRDPWPAIQSLLNVLHESSEDVALNFAIGELIIYKDPKFELYPNEEGLVVIASLRISLPDEQDKILEELEFEEPEDDEASIINSGRRTLFEHTEAVKNVVIKFAKESGLNKEFESALALAAQWHDQGKRDLRFQAWLHGSELKALVSLANDQPLAKSGRDPKQWKSSEAFGYPRCSRHEFVSVQLFEKTELSKDESGQLSKFLIGTHHGYGRAFVPVVRDRNPVEISLNHNGKSISTSSDHRLYRLDSDWVDLFWKLIRRYGWWGLAYLGSLLIMSDRFASSIDQKIEQGNEGKEVSVA